MSKFLSFVIVYLKFDVKKLEIALVRQVTADTFQSSEIYKEICQKMSRCMRKRKKVFVHLKNSLKT